MPQKQQMSEILVDSMLYNSDGRPTDFKGYVLALEDSPPGYVEGLMQDCTHSVVNALELLQSCAKPSMCSQLTGLCIAWQHAWIRFSVLLAYDISALKTVPKILISSTFWNSLPPPFTLAGFWRVYGQQPCTCCSGSVGASEELSIVWRCPINMPFSTLDCSIVSTCLGLCSCCQAWTLETIYLDLYQCRCETSECSRIHSIYLTIRVPHDAE